MTNLKVVKRDGRIVDFDSSKIEQAVLAAFRDCDEVDDYARAKAQNIAEYIQSIAEKSERPLTVEELNDFCENGLMACKKKNVARCFITYRNERTRIRNQKLKVNQTFEAKLMATNVENQNANLDERSFGGRKGEASDVLLKQYALENLVSETARRNHEENRVYIHDLSSYALGDHNCLTIPFDDLLANGFNTRQVDIRPANSINTAFQLMAVIFQIQSLQQFGGVSSSHMDWTMVPYVRKSFWKHYKDGYTYIEGIDWSDASDHSELSIEDDFYKTNYRVYKYALDMTKKELKQACEGLYHNLNSLQSRSGNQLPFSSVNFGTCTLPEGRLVIQYMLESCINGTGKHHKTSIFPCVIFQVGEGINKRPEDPNYDLFRLALKSTAKRLYPNYANIDWSGNEGYDKNDPRTYFSTMGKRKLQLM